MATDIDYNAVDFKNFEYPETYITIAVSVVSFTSLYMMLYYVLMPNMVHPYFNHIKSNMMLHWKIVGSTIGAVHSICIISLCIAFSDILSFSLTSEVVRATESYKERLIASISFGYFIYDLIIWCIIYSIIHTGKPDYITMIHHGVAIIAFAICIISVYGSRIIIVVLFLSDINNPLLNLNNVKNYFLNGASRNNKSILLIDFTMKLIYIISYILARFVGVGRLLFQMLFIFPCNTGIQIVTITGLVVSVLLLPATLKDLSKTYAKYKSAESIQYFPVDQEEFLFPYLKSLGIYWIYDIITGFTLGVLSMTSEYIILEIQPTKYSGKVNAAKGLLRNWLIALCLLVISIWWEITHNSFYYVVTVSFMFALFCSVAMIYAKHNHKAQQPME